VSGEEAKYRGEENCIEGKPEGKKPLGRSRRRQQSLIIIDLNETEWCDVDLVFLLQDRGKKRAVLNTVIQFRVS
jgi:hypothetical protein